MSTLDLGNPRRKMFKIGFVYLLVSLFCVLFGAIYEFFSHEVYSYFMIYAFIFPLVGGALPFLAIGYFGMPVPGKRSSNLYHSGIVTLTVGSIFQGILEIYGTTNRLVWVYWIAGTIFLFLGLVGYFVGMGKNRTKSSFYT